MFDFTFSLATFSGSVFDNVSFIFLFLDLQDDIIPRLSVASLGRLRNEILETDWFVLDLECFHQ